MGMATAYMSTSFIEYQGYGFWSWDGYLEHVLALLARQIGNSPNQIWLAELRDHWQSQASGVFRGWIHPNLDEFITDDERRNVVLGLLNEVLSTTGLNREAEETARLLEALLRRQVHTDASSKLDYMVNGPQPYKWSLQDVVDEERDRSDERTK